MPRETRGKKRISKARYAGQKHFFDKLSRCTICAAAFLISAIYLFLIDIQQLAETLEMYHLALAQELYYLVDVGVV